MTSFSTMKPRRVDKMYHVYPVSSSLKIFVQILSVLVWKRHHRWNGWRDLDLIKLLHGFDKVVLCISVLVWICHRRWNGWRKLRPEFGEKSLYKLLPPLWVKSCGFKRGGNHQNQRHGFLQVVTRICQNRYLGFSKLLHVYKLLPPL